MDHREEPLPINQKVAIVGIGCRYGNGVDSVKSFWEMLVKGLDCTTPIPPDRFDASYFLSPGEKTVGKMYIEKGGYISQDPYMFDRQFFKIPKDEAAHLDPQVRLLLEVTWEALENAGIPASSVRGSKTGVYMGVTAQEYVSFACKPFHNMNQYSNSGTNSCMVANRVSYEFDFRGPSFSVDTACSSSLYSIFLACEALKRKSCSMAVAGGVNLILSASINIGFCQAGMLSADGKCKSFDQAADGYSRSEGAGVLVLKPLEDALKNGDRIYAVVRGGALSNDGRTPGIVNPSFDAQVDLVKSACHNARVDPHQIVYAEAHGTGTRVGDTTEAGALGEAMGRRREPRHPPLYIGSVKSNLGHSESAAGVAGVIKVALCLHQRKIPPVVHFKTPNENVDFKALKINIPTKLIQWPETDSQLLSSCSSFGFGGANANLILEGRQFPNWKAKARLNDDKATCLLLSAASSEALRQKMKDWVEFLTKEADMTITTFYKCLYTSACRSQHHTHRVGFAVHSREDALHQLRTKLDEESPNSSRCVEGVASTVSDVQQQIVFVFSGMGTQWWGMARELMQTQPVFAARIKVIDKLLQTCGAKWSLVSMLSEEKDRERINQTEISQPCLCAVAIGLLDLWKMRGVIPDAVVGHSVGEVAAAYAAGLLSLEQTVKLIYRRGRELRKTSGSGKMVAVLHRVEEALQLIRNNEHGQKLDVAAINSPGQVVVSGDSSSIEGLANELKTNDIKCVVLKVNNAFHSKQQEVVRKPFLKKVGKFLKSHEMTETSNTIPMMSTVTGRYLTAEEANSPEYWFQNVRQRVSFMEAIQSLAKDGYKVFIEIGPHVTLQSALKDTLTNLQTVESKYITTASLARPRDTNILANDSENLLLSQIRLHVNGVQVSFENVFAASSRHVLSVPHYPWQRERCSNVTAEGRRELLFPIAEDGHLLLGEPRDTFYLRESPVKVWRADLNASKVPWVKDHVLDGTVVVPAAAYIETALAVGRSMNDNHYPLLLSGLMFERFMFAPDAEGCFETTLEEKTSHQCLFTLRSHEASRGKWTQHCQLKISIPSPVDVTDCKLLDKLDLESVTQRCELTLPGDEFYVKASECGFQLGPTFRGVRTVAVSKDFREGLFYAEAPPSVQREFHRYVYHPAFMDNCLQAFGVLLFNASESANQLSGKALQTVRRVPKGMKKFNLLGPTPTRLFIHVKVSSTDRSLCNIDLANAETKEIFCKVWELVFETIQTDRMEQQVYSTLWDNIGSLQITDAPGTSPTILKNVVIFPDDSEVSALMVDSLAKEDSLDLTVIEAAGDPVQRALSVVSAGHESDTILIIMKTEMANICSNSGTVMSRTEFGDSQAKGALFCYSICKGLLTNGLTKPKLVLITKGAHHAKEGDEVNPFAAVLNTLQITLNHEEPLVQCFTIDLPMTASNDECVRIAQKIICREDYVLHDENVFAVRSPTLPDKVHLNRTWDVLSPRLKMGNISEAPAVVPSSVWSVGVQKASARHRIVVQKKQPIQLHDTDKDTIRIKVEAFSVYHQQKVEGESRGGANICVFAGRPDLEPGSEEVFEKYLCMTICDEVRACMTSPSSDLSKVPDCLTSKEAVSIVNDYFPGALLFNQVLQISPRMCVLIKSDFLDSGVLPIVDLAIKLRAEVIVLKDGCEDQDMPIFEIGVKCLNEIAQSSVDVLILSVKLPSLEGSLYSLLPKLGKNATVVIMQRQNQDTRLQMLPSKIKLVLLDADIPSCFDGLSRVDISQTLSNLWNIIHTGVAGSLLPFKSRKLNELVSAQNAHISGGDVIEVGRAELLLPLSLENDGFVADKGSAYFITGGTRGFGLRLLEWLVSREARYIYTCGRGEITDDLRQVIHRAEKLGAKVQYIQMDIASAADVETGLKRMKNGQWPALKGIFHCAAFYNDASLYNTTAESWNSVMAPKAYGALLLHQLTMKLGIHLDHFIMTSSIVSLIGSAGQGSYCAANIFLNALAQHRHSIGLPATAVQIGVINSVGFAMRNGLVQTWENTGVVSMSPEEVLGSVGCALSVRQPQLGISGFFNRKVYASSHPGLIAKHFAEEHGVISILKDIYHDRSVYLTSTNDTVLQSIVKLPFVEAEGVVTKTLATLFSQKLELSDEVPHDASPISLGLDSLMASEVSQMISQHFEVTVRAVDLLNDKNSIHELSKNITRQMLAKADGNTSGGGLDSRELAASSQRMVVIEGKVPKLLGVKLVCFPSNGAGPSMFASWVQPLLEHGVQLLMIQLPGWEGREDERPMKDMSSIIRLIHDELLAYLSEIPFVFFAHSMGSLIAFEVAHLLLSENNMCPYHVFVSSWYAPSSPYPHSKDLEVTTSTFERLKRILEGQPKLFQNLTKVQDISFSFLDDSFLSNVALMRRLIPAIEAAVEMLRVYTCKHKKPLPCHITAFGGKQDEFAPPELLSGWGLHRSKNCTFKKMTFPGKHMFILTNTAEILKVVCDACKNAVVGR